MIVTVLVGVIAVAVVVATIVWHILRKKQGKTGCGCDCSGCAGCSSCVSRKTKETKKDKNKKSET